MLCPYAGRLQCLSISIRAGSKPLTMLHCAGPSAREVADAAAMRHCNFVFLKVVINVMLLLVSEWMKVCYSDRKLVNQLKIHLEIQRPLQ